MKVLAIVSILIVFGLTSCLMDRERYELLKSGANFDVLEYEQYVQIFAKKDFENSRLAGEYTYQQELAFLESDRVVHVYSNKLEGGEVRQLGAYPDFYDTRAVYPGCFTDVVKDQMDCGGCW